MANTRSRALKAKQPTKKTLAAKRKADVLADDVEADADSTLDLDEDIIKKAKQLIADVRS